MPAKTKLPPVPEKEVLKNGMGLLRDLGCEVFRRNTGAFSGVHKGKSWFVKFSDKGASDVWGFLCDGHATHFEWEAKRLGERPTLDQVKWLRRINAITGAAFWTDSVATLEIVAQHLIAGGRIEYLDTMWRFGKVESLGGDYDLV